MDSTRVGTLVVVDQDHRLVGLLTERDARFVNSEALVLERMTPRLSLVVHTGPNSLAEAEEVMRERKIKKLPLVDNNDKLVGLITAKDILNHKRHPFATRDDQGRLRVAAAVGATGDYLERADELIRAGADVLVIDIAHGHSEVMDRAIRDLRKRCNCGRRPVPRRARGEWNQSRYWARRRVHHAFDYELRRAAGGGARSLSSGR